MNLWYNPTMPWILLPLFLLKTIEINASVNSPLTTDSLVKASHAPFPIFSFIWAALGLGLLALLVYFVRLSSHLRSETRDSRHTLARLRSALRASGEGLYDWPDTRRPDGWWLSERFYQITSLSPASFEANVDSIGDLIHPEDRSQMSFLRADKLREDEFHIEFRMLIGSQYRWMSTRGSVLRNEKDGYRVSGLLQDIHEYKIREQSKASAYQQVVERNLALESIFSTLKHDFLSASLNTQGYCRELVIAQASLCEKIQKADCFEATTRGAEILDLLYEELIPYTNHILSSNTELEQMLERLGPMIRLLRIKTQNEILDMNILLTQCIEELHNKPQYHDLKMHLETVPHCLGDPNLMADMFKELIQGLLRLHGLKIELHIEGWSTHNQSHYRVFHAGASLPSEFLDSMNASKQSIQSGSGCPSCILGLALITTIVKTLNGTIQCANLESGGTEFIFTFEN